jgi:hypothetical protein
LNDSDEPPKENPAQRQPSGNNEEPAQTLKYDGAKKLQPETDVKTWLWTGVGTSSARVRIRLCVGRIVSAVLRSPGTRSLARLGQRLAQLQAIGAEDSDNGECAKSDLFKEFGF